MTKKADILLHPIRIRIIHQLLQGKALTISQLADELGNVPQATLYRHMNLLLKTNHIEVIDKKKVKGTEERVFSVKKDNLLVSTSEIEKHSQEDHIRHFSVFHGNLLQQVTSYLMNTPPNQYEKDGFAYWYAPIHLTDEEYQKLIESINHCMEEFIKNEPTPERTTRTFAGMFIPQKSQK